MGYKLTKNDSGPVLEYRTGLALLGWGLLGLAGLGIMVLAVIGAGDLGGQDQLVVGCLGLEMLCVALTFSGLRPPGRLVFDNNEGVLRVGDQQAEATIPYDQIDRFKQQVSVRTSTQNGKRKTTTTHQLQLRFRDGASWVLASARRKKAIDRLMGELEAGARLDSSAGAASATGPSALVIERDDRSATIRWKQRPRPLRSLGMLGMIGGMIVICLVVAPPSTGRLAALAFLGLIAILMISSIAGKLRAEHRVAIDTRTLRYTNTARGMSRMGFELELAKLDALMMGFLNGGGDVRLSFVTGSARKSIDRARQILRDPSSLVPEDVRSRVRGIADDARSLDPSAIREAGVQMVSEIERLDAARDRVIDDVASEASSLVEHARNLSRMTGQAIDLVDLHWADRVQLEQTLQREIGRITGNTPA